MPRQARMLEDGRCYHIITRGNDRRRLFRVKQDFLWFLKLVKEGLRKYDVRIYHYCLMTNHIHILIKAVKAKDVPIFFKFIFQRYAQNFRKRYHNAGYLFQNRYKSYQIDKDSYLLDCGRYIERNPLRAGLVVNLSEYPWNSYLYYAHGRADDIIKEPNPLFLQLGTNDEERRRKYIEYIMEDRPYEHLVDKGLRI